MRRLVSLPFIFACCIFALMALVWRAADLFGVENGLITLGYAIAPWAALATLALMFVGLFAKKAAAAQLMLFASIMYGSTFTAQLLPRQPTQAAAPLTIDGRALPIRVLSLNAWMDRDLLERDRAVRVADMIRDADPDIVFLQEINERNLRVVIGELGDQGPRGMLYMAGSGLEGFGVLSRFPLRDEASVNDPMRALSVFADTPAGALRLWNIHAYRENLMGGVNFLAYPDLTQHRPLREQSAWLLQQLALESIPVIVAGDFNAPTYSPAHRALTAMLNDVHIEAGQGLGFTFPANSTHVRKQPIGPFAIELRSPVRLTRIDHVFASRQFRVNTARVLEDSADSDHAPVLAELTLQ